MAISETSKVILTNTLKEWMKFAVERERLTLAANELAVFTRKVVQEDLAFLKAQNLDIQCDSPDEMKILGVPVHIDPMIEAVFPNVKASVILKCSGSTRAILVNPNMTISAGGTVMTFDQLKKGIPEPFGTNTADFVRDSFLYVARSGAKEE
ncbi:MAG: hypothetical protein NTX44_00990 [Ignavibacteriales bacterium]|nr:hypothetical protein [Ignavibacteriales bacterium]